MSRPPAATPANLSAELRVLSPACTPGCSASGKRLLDLALQGGGSHGAYTWGVLDRLLEVEDLEISGISGTSAGAMNAVAVAAGLMNGGRQGARALLGTFWRRVAEASPFNALRSDPWSAWLAERNPWSVPWRWATEWAQRELSPYQLNPLNLNPLRGILNEVIDFERVRRCSKVKLFIAATQVSTGELRLFRQDGLNADQVLASACLPMLFQAVSLPDESGLDQAFWDGGYAGNPSLLPLVQDTPADDLLLVQINPTVRAQVPRRARDILDRTNEIVFNASLLKELRHIAMLKQLMASECTPGAPRRDPLWERVQALRLHQLDADAALAEFGASSKLDTRWTFLQELHRRGCQRAEAWLAGDGQFLGQRTTLHLPQGQPA